MKNSQLKRFFHEHLESQLPEFAIQKSLMYMPPVDYVLKAVNFRTSTFSKSLITFDMFIQPLFTPGAGTSGLLHKQLGYFDLDTEDEPSVAKKIITLVNEKAVPLFSKYTSSPADIISLFARTKDSNELEALAYAFVLTEQWAEAIATLERLLHQLRKEFDERPDATYYEERIVRVRQMLEFVETEPSRAIERLEEYRTTALRELGLVK